MKALATELIDRLAPQRGLSAKFSHACASVLWLLSVLFFWHPLVGLASKADLRAAIAAEPSSLLNYMTLVTQYEKHGNWEEARWRCEKAHTVAADAPLVADELALLDLEHGGQCGRIAGAIRMPDSPITADALGWAYYKLGSFSSALVQLKDSCDQAPNNAIYRYHFWTAYMRAWQFDLARQSLRAALRTDLHFTYAAQAQTALQQMAQGAR